MPPKPRLLRYLDGLTIVMMAIATTLVFFYTPVERVMGLVQKVFYFHVAANWVGMLGFIVAAGAGIAYLVSGNLKWDVMEVASVEIGMVFSLIGIITGSIWARPVWNTWWTWDPRLVTVTIMELVYAAYLMLRQGLDEPERRARFGAVYAIVGVLSVPLTFLSIRLFRTIHPVVIGNASPLSQGEFNMSPRMLRTFFFSLITFTVLYADLLWHRTRLGHLAAKIERLRIQTMQ